MTDGVQQAFHHFFTKNVSSPLCGFFLELFISINLKNPDKINDLWYLSILPYLSFQTGTLTVFLSLQIFSK